MDPAIQAILIKHELSITESRTEILSLFLESSASVEHSQIEIQTQNRFNRATVYRTLRSFIEKGIVHRIPTYDSSVRYGLCRSDCDVHQHQDHHIHFCCNACGKIVCLDQINAPLIKLPEGYRSDRIDALVSGLCTYCSGQVGD